MRRFKKLSVTEGVLLGFFKRGEKHFLVSQGVPEGAEIRDIEIVNRDPTVIEALVYSDEFEEVPEGGEIPLLGVSAMRLQQVTKPE